MSVVAMLIVEDDRALNEGLAYAFGSELDSVVSAYSYEEGLEAVKRHMFQLVLLDVNLPDKPGTELCAAIRQSSDVPIVFLTANDTEEEMVRGFQLGADDYIAKPFSMAVLRERVKAVLRRSSGDEEEEGSQLIYKDLLIHYDKMKVFKRGEECKLSATEWRLLEMLSQHRSQVLTRETIVEKLWDVDGNFVDENTLSVNIRRLRNKIEDDPKHPDYVKTVFGIGYTWGE